ncbi:MAG TPA: hypothetical protein VGQ47_01155 [Candidatus Limnocylindrales bacterium]|jgi:hypothetical protein|nr:hypothetical protein [Candidatus Limnocylindrales bacterium]
MTDQPVPDRDQPALDPNEAWGQDVDASHPDPTGQVDRGGEGEHETTSDDVSEEAERIVEGAERAAQRAAEQRDDSREGS